ncbi:MAG: ribosome maturation factor RimP [Sulfuricurvum sp.]
MSLESDIKKIVESIGLALYDTQILNENENTIYRVSITARGGVTLDQCTQVTHLINPLLDVTPPMSGEYRLEVSSPGIERRLKTLDHFKQSVGEKALVNLIGKEKFEGEILEVVGEEITLLTDDQGEQKIPFRSISKAKTYFQW